MFFQTNLRCYHKRDWEISRNSSGRPTKIWTEDCQVQLDSTRNEIFNFLSSFLHI